jgi:hypothetical protein
MQVGTSSAPGILFSITSHAPSSSLAKIATIAKSLSIPGQILAALALYPILVPPIFTIEISLLSSLVSEQSMIDSDFHSEQGWFTMRTLFKITTVASMIGLTLTSTLPFFNPWNTAYLQLLFAYPLLISVKPFLDPIPHAMNFHRDIPLKMLFSFSLLTMAQLKVGMGLSKPLVVAAAICTLPVIAEFFHRKYGLSSSLIISKIQMRLRNSSIINCGLPLAVGAATGSISYFTLSIIYAFCMSRLQDKPLNFNGFKLLRKTTEENRQQWEIEVRPNTNLQDQRTQQVLKWLVSLSANLSGLKLHPPNATRQQWHVEITGDIKKNLSQIHQNITFLRALPNVSVTIEGLSLQVPPTIDGPWNIELTEDGAFNNQAIKKIVNKLPDNCSFTAPNFNLESRNIPRVVNELLPILPHSYKPLFRLGPGFYLTSTGAASFYSIKVTDEVDLDHPDTLKSIQALIKMTALINNIDITQGRTSDITLILRSLFKERVQVEIGDAHFKKYYNDRGYNICFNSLDPFPISQNTTNVIKSIFDNAPGLINSVKCASCSLYLKRNHWVILDSLHGSSRTTEINALRFLSSLRPNVTMEGIEKSSFEKIRQLPDAGLIPEKWQPFALQGNVLSYSVGNGLYILDRPPQNRIAVFDQAAIDRSIPSEELEQMLSAYCGVPIGDIKGTENPKTPEEWIPILNRFFTTHPSKNTNRAIATFYISLKEKLHSLGLANVHFNVYSNGTEITFKISGLDSEEIREQLFEVIHAFHKVVTHFEIAGHPPIPTVIMKHCTREWGLTNLILVGPPPPIAPIAGIPLPNGWQLSAKVAEAWPKNWNLERLSSLSQELEVQPGIRLTWISKESVLDDSCFTLRVPTIPSSPLELAQPVQAACTSFPFVKTIQLGDFSIPVASWQFFSEMTASLTTNQQASPLDYQIRSTELILSADARPSMASLKECLQNHAAIESVSIQGMRPIWASVIRQWPAEWECDLAGLLTTLSKQFPRCFEILWGEHQAIDPNTMIDEQSWILNVTSPPGHNLPVLFLLNEILEKFPLISTVRISGQELDISWFTADLLESTKRLEITNKEEKPLLVHPSLLLESGTLRDFCRSFFNPPYKMEHALIYEALPTLNAYGINHASLILTSENVDHFRNLATYLQIPSLLEKCDAFDIEGAWKLP